MALTINTNMMALMAANNLARSYNALTASVNKLSSGLRINSAADDAAGLAIRELLRSDVAVLNQGIRNANDAISMLQVMDGAAGVIDEKLIRMKELAEQSATGTYSNEQRRIIQEEFDQMRREIERIAQATDFNGIRLLNGEKHDRIVNSTTQTVIVGASSGSAGLSAVFPRYASGDVVTVYWTTKDGTAGSAFFTVTTAAHSVANAFMDSVANAAGAAFAGVQFSASAGGFIFTAAADGESLATLRFSDGTVTYYATRLAVGYDAGTDVVNDVKIHFGTGNNPAEDYYYVGRQDFTAAGLGIDALSIESQDAAQAALNMLHDAIITKDMGRAHFGAMMNRFANTVTNLTIQAENIQAAESQISDVDVALEMTKFMNTQIKAQAAIAMLAQATQLPSLALSLLGG